MNLDEITKAVLTKIAARETPPTHQEIIALTVEEALENLSEFKEDVRLDRHEASKAINDSYYHVLDEMIFNTLRR